MRITRAGEDTSNGPAESFTGTVSMETIVAPTPPSRLGAADVHFEAGARTAWHSHPLGQTLFVTDGEGLCQREGAATETIRPGDRVWFEPGENHWHGATPDREMTHVAMQEADEAGSFVVWGEQVTDEQYGPPR